MKREALSRRQFLTASLREPDGCIFPPGVIIENMTACTGCGECVEACPTKIIGLNNGLPELHFRSGECTFCGECASVCPEPVFSAEPISSFDHVIAFESSCLAFNRVDCQACRDACPTAAIRFRPVRGGPFIPELSAEHCTGCGACIAICPVDAVTTQQRLAEVHHA